MQYKSLAVLFTLAALGAAQDIDDNDVPLPCRNVCASVVSLTTNCDRQNDDDGTAYRNCICQAQNAATDVPNCAACVAANGGTDFDDDDDNSRDNDVIDIVRACSFSTASWTGASATATGVSPTGTGIAPAPGPGNTTQDINNDDIPPACRNVCASVVSLSTDCDRQHDDDSVAYRNCVCQAQNAATDLSNCASCVSANGGTDFDDDDDNSRENDVIDIVRACGFSTTGGTGGAAATPVTTTNSAGSTIVSTPTATGGTTGTGTAATGASATGGPATFTGAAAMPTAAIKGIAMVALVGLPVVL